MGSLPSLPISLIDLIVLVVLAVSGLLGLVRGFVHEVLGIFAWIGAGAATLYGFARLQPYAREYITIPLIADVATGVAIFLVVLIVCSLLVRVLATKIKESALGMLDRSLGLAFGLFRAVLLLCLLWLGFTVWVPKDDWPDWVEEAKSPPLLGEGAAILVRLVPPELVESSGDTLRQILEGGADIESLTSPVTKDDASRSEPGYKAGDSGAIEQLIEENAQ